MAERLIIDIANMDTGFEVEYHDKVLPHGVEREGVWNSARLEDAVGYVKKNIDARGKDVIYKGLASSWVLYAVDDAMAPHRAFHVTAYLDGLEAEIKALPFGENDARSGLEFEYEEDGGDLYITVTCDDQTLSYHNYDINLLQYAKVPPITEKENIYLWVKGATCCILTFAKTYAPFAKNLFLWAFHDNFPKKEGEGQNFGCAKATAPGCRLGEIREIKRGL